MPHLELGHGRRAGAAEREAALVEPQVAADRSAAPPERIEIGPVTVAERSSRLSSYAWAR